MKKALASLLIALLLLAVCLCASGEGDVSALAVAAGLDAEASGNPDGAIFCDYTLLNSASAAMSWSDAAQVYTVEGDPDAVAQIYVDALSLGGWESCRYIVGKKARISFGTDSRQVCQTPEEYLEQMQAALGVAVSLAAAPAADVHDYVLNTNTKKFHHPNCPSVNQMKPKNRQDYTGTREEVIAMGYDPCGNCKP